MSLASTYAAGMATAQAALPTPYVGPGGLMNASTDANGNMVITALGQTFTATSAVALEFATWINATFE